MADDPMAASNTAAQTRVTAARAKRSRTVKWGVIGVMAIVALIIVPRLIFGSYPIDGRDTGGQNNPPAPVAKAEPWNNAAGYLDPIVVQPGQTSPEVANGSALLQVCHNIRPPEVSRQVQLETGEWIDSAEQGGRTVIAVRVTNHGTSPWTWTVWRQSPDQPC